MKLFLLSSILIISFDLLGQGKLDFEFTNHNFGYIEEMVEPAEFIFNFVNNANKNITITHVKASCGCTTPAWTSGPIMPSDSGFVKVKYNPKNRPGKFNKSIQVSTTSSSSNEILYISGFVKPRPKNPEQDFPIVRGKFRLKSQELNLGRMTTEKIVEKTFDIYNESTDTIEFLTSEKLALPTHITIRLEQPFLAPQTAGKFTISYDPQKKTNFGFVSDYIQLVGLEGNVSITAVIAEYFPEMTAEALEESPKLHISEQLVSFGKVTRGKMVELELDLMNVGEKELFFRTIKSDCGCLTYEIKNRTIKKEEIQRLKIFLDTSEIRGYQYKSITIYSNDPVNPTQIITIKGDVLE